MHTKENERNSLLSQNTEQTNRTMANILLCCLAVISVMVLLSALGLFRFESTYILILVFGGLFTCLLPKILLLFLSNDIMKYYMIISTAVFIGIIGADRDIGIYITYALVPMLSCLYFDPTFVLKSSGLSYLVMLVSFYFASGELDEVVYLGRPHMQVFTAYAAGFTLEYVIVTIVLYTLVKRAKNLYSIAYRAEAARKNAEMEQHMFDALCADYVAAYCCDLRKDTVKVIKQKKPANSTENEISQKTYSEWLGFVSERIIAKESAADYLEVFSPKNLMQRLQTEESFFCRYKVLPNVFGMEYFETAAVFLYADEDSFKIIIGNRPIDNILREEKQRQEQLEEALQETKRADVAKTNFLSRMSHDIRTPLNGIIGLLKINETHFDDTELVWANQKKMETVANHLLSLINDVLQMSKLEDGHIELTHERISVFELTLEIINIIIGRATDNGLKWEYEKEKEIIPYPYIYGSPLHLRQIFLNIYGNCIKYTHAGGSIRTVVETLSDGNGICTYRWTISDTGIGMSEEFLKHIFEPFAQERIDARSNYEGTGLGMSIVKGLLEQMGGNISISSKEGVGTTFVITIPFEIAPAPEADAEKNNTSEHSLNGMNLMLTEDNDLNVEIAKILLEDAGAKVIVASNGKQSVELFEKSPAGTFDAILMDVMMPVMDGLEATRKIRAIDRPDAKTIPIIAMTANAFVEDAEKCIEAGMNEHLAKPLDIEKVKRVIYEHVENTSYHEKKEV